MFCEISKNQQLFRKSRTLTEALTDRGACRIIYTCLGDFDTPL